MPSQVNASTAPVALQFGYSVNFLSAENSDDLWQADLRQDDGWKEDCRQGRERCEHRDEIKIALTVPHPGLASLNYGHAVASP